MSEEKFEEFLKQHAPTYNAPGETPRDAMWTAITAARQQRAASGIRLVDGAAPKANTTKSWLRFTPWIGMAATLLLGVGIGRYAMQNGPATGVQSQIAQTSLPAVTEVPTESSAAPAAAPTEVSSPDAPVATPLTRRAPSTRRDAADLAPALTPAITPVNQASREHLVRAEALISVIAATPADAVMDSLTGRWARDMLTNTRLLLDSPAGEDPSRRQLLEDLETVLVQLVQRSGAPVEERALLDRSLQRTQLLTRLRTGAAGI